jgi:hypothetical protein
MNCHRTFLRRYTAWSLAVMGVLLAGALARAGLKYPVTGFYSFQRVTDLGDEVRVTLNMRLVNTSDEDFSEAKLVLGSPRPWVHIRGTVPPLLLRPHSEDSFTEDFTLPSTEYERWRKGERPLLVMQFHRADGKVMKQLVRLVLRPATQEQ